MSGSLGCSNWRRKGELVGSARRLDVRGVVQGVGFRPFVYRLAHSYKLTGWVRNTSWGVELEVEGDEQALERFAEALRQESPPLAHIESVDVREVAPNGYDDFVILASQPQAGAYQLVSPDIATCADCRREIFDPADRRYHYPFTNCTNCGPRFTIIEDVPYDRPRTTMRAFRMCPACQREYDDPLDRRFHAQPNACPVCGPHLTLVNRDGEVIAKEDALDHAVMMLRAGHIVAIKGLGGYQLACDATNAEIVALLRQRKHRPHKPLAVMIADLDAANMHVALTDAERDLLSSPNAPIVLVLRKSNTAIAAQVAPGQRYLGVMLPYTPLHHLLLAAVGFPLVMTSGNLSEEPIARDNDEALRRLGAIADGFLMHNRDIYARYDDSVWFAPASGPQPIRRARGYAPSPVRLPFEMRPILACGAELKNTFCLTRDRYAFLSQHIGDMENLETFEHYQETVALYRRLFHVAPEIVAYDMHPDYMATHYGREQNGEKIAVQHHHAHLAACLADNGIAEPAIGVIWDGTGYGLDGCIWGGEFLVGDGRGFQRAAHLQYLPLPGGDRATIKPYRVALAYHQALAGDDTLPESLTSIPAVERQALRQMIGRGINTPLTSSAGRLFDAVSSLLGVCRETSYEAQAAIEMEMIAEPDSDAVAYSWGYAETDAVQSWGVVRPWVSRNLELGLASLWAGLERDLAEGHTIAHIAWRFHFTVAAMIADTCGRLRAETGLDRVALSGGCFQNRLLLEFVVPRLQAMGFQVLLHRQIPCNDGGLALGQAVIAHYAVGGG